MKMTRKISIIIVLLFISLFNVHAAAGNLELSITGSSNNTDVLNPAEYAADDNMLTYWALDPEETNGWFEVSLDELSCIYAIELSGTLDTENVINFEYNSDGIWKSFINTEITSIGSSGEYIDLSGYKIVTDKIRVYLQGEDTSYSFIEEFSIFGESYSDTYHKLGISNVSGEENIFYPLSNLTDENTKTYWETESIGTWIVSILQGAKNWITDCFETGNFNFRKRSSLWEDENGAVISLAETSTIYRIKAYLSQDYSGKIILNKLDDDEWTEISVIEEGTEPGWYIIDLPDGLNTDSIQIISEDTDWWSLFLGLDTAEITGLCEIEFWGKSDLPSSKDLTFYTEDTNIVEGLNSVFSTSESENYEVELVVDADAGDFTCIELNGTQVQIPFIQEIEGAFYYQSIIDNDLLWNGDNFLRLESSDYHLLSGSIVGLSKDGSLSFSDGIKDYFTADSTGYNEIEFDSEISLEEVLLTTNDVSNERVYYRSENQWFELAWSGVSEHSEIYSIFLSESGNNTNLVADCIRIEGLTSGEQYGVTVKGSRISDSAPQIQMYWPKNGEVIEQSGLGTMFAVGYVDDENAVITVNDEAAQNIGNLFWIANMPGDVITDGEYALHIAATDSEGRTTEKTIYWSNIDSNVYNCDLGEDIIYTLDDSITVEGGTNPSATVYINDEIVDSSSQRYSKDIELAPGLNIITIKFVHRTQGVFALLQRRIFLVTTEPVLEISQPNDIDYISVQQIDVSGILSVSGAYEIECEGYKVQDDGTLFTVPSVTLVSGAYNDIIVTLTDQFGRTSTDSVSVFCDINAPVLTGITPESGSILSESVNTFVITTSDESELSVFMDGLVVPGGSGIFEKTISLLDGFYSLSLVLKDKAGNTTQVYLDYTVDTVPPVDFTVDVTPAGWTSDNQPIISFETTDATSGVDCYELSIDEGSFYVIESPYQLPVQSEGEHTIAVRAVDNAGHMTYSYAETKTDTIPPDILTDIEIVPGNGQLVLKWEDGNDDVIAYEIVRTPAWDLDEQIRVDRADEIQEYLDTEVIDGNTYSYFIRSVDRAENKGVFSAANSAIPGIETELLIEDGITKVEYETATLYLKKEGLPGDAVSVRIAEADPEWQTEADEDFEHDFVGAVYNFSLLDSNGEDVSSGDVFSQPYIGIIDYNPELLPEGFNEENLSVYTFDRRWGRWERIEDCSVVPESNQIVFTSMHFSMYAPVATSVQDLSPEEIADAGYSPFGTYVNHEGFTVSPQGGNAHTSMTELVLTGPSGFDFELKRYYDLTVAKMDTRADIPSWAIKYLENQGDYAYSMGKGWRLNLPYIKNASSQQYLVMPDGSMYGFESLELEDSSIISTNRTLYLEGHTGEHFSLMVKQSKKEEEVYFIGAEGVVEHTWTSLYYILTLNDGTRYVMDSKGRTKKILSPESLEQPGFLGFLNLMSGFEVNISYVDDGYEISQIEDSIGRKINFEYAGISDSLAVPYITKISLDSNDPYGRSISYTQNDGYLTSCTDVGGRTWTYSYDNAYYIGGASNPIPFNLTDALDDYSDDSELNDLIDKLSEPTSNYTYKPLYAIEGSGKGRIEVTYDTDSQSLDGEDYLKVVTRQVAVFNDHAAGSDESVRATWYDYSFTYNDDIEGYYLSKTIVNELNDNRYTVYNYEYRKLVETYWNETDDGEIDEVTVYASEDAGNRISSTIFYEKINNDIDNLSLLKDKSIEYIADTDINPSAETIKHGSGSDYLTMSYSYDGWGNKETVTEENHSSGRIRKNITYRIFSSGNQVVGASFKDYSNSGLTNGSIPARIKSLIIKEEIDNYSPIIVSNGTASNDVGTAKKEYIYYSYNDDGRITGKAIWDSSNNKWQKTDYVWNSVGDMTQVTNPDGHIIAYTYDDDHYLSGKTEKAIKDVDGNSSDLSWLYDYDWTGWKVSETDPKNQVITLTYDKLGRITSKSEPGDAGGIYKTSVSYNDSLGSLSSVMTDSFGREVKREYNDLGQMVKQSSYIASDKAAIVELSYDRWGNVVEMINPNMLMDDAGDKNEYITYYSYNALGRLDKISYPYESDTGSVYKSMDYNYNTNTLTITDEEGNQTVELYDMKGNILKRTQSVDGESIITSFWYDGLGNMIAQQGPISDAVITNQFNSLNQLVNVKQPSETFYENGVLTTSRPEVSYYYDENGDVVKESKIVSDGERITLTEYDELGRTIAVEYKDGDEVLASEKYYYDELNNLEKKIDPNNLVTNYTYTPRNNIKTETDPEGWKTSYEYYEDGLIKSTIDPRGNSGNYSGLDFKVTYNYDNLKRLTSAELPAKVDGGERLKITFEYDLLGNLTKQTGIDGLVTTYEYTPRRWLRSQNVTGDGKSYLTENEYDKKGNITKTVDPRGERIVMDYDELDRLIYKKSAEDDINRFDYDEAGNLIESSWYKNGIEISARYDYDDYGRLLTQYLPVETSDNSTDIEKALLYDRLGNLTKETDALGNSVYYEYDGLNRLVQETSDAGFTKSYDYDDGGRLIESIDANGNVSSYGYNDRGLLLVRNINGINGAKSLTYDYDEAGNLKWAQDDSVYTGYNGAEPGLNGSYIPDVYGRIKAVMTQLDGNNFDIEYQYNISDQLVGITGPDGNTVDYSYNLLGEILDVEGYLLSAPVYDEGGLITSITAANGVSLGIEYDGEGRITDRVFNGQEESFEKKYYLSYDTAGNISTLTNASGVQSTYSYDIKNQLISAYLRGGFGIATENTTNQETVAIETDDVNGEGILEEVDKTEISLDHAAGSIGVSLNGSYKVARIYLNPESVDNRVESENLRIFLSADNTEGSYIEQTDFRINENEEGGFEIILRQPVTASFVKVMTDFNERDIDYNPVDNSEFKGSPEEIIKVYHYLSLRIEKYNYDNAGNRTSEKVSYVSDEFKGVDKTYEYYPKTNRVLTDGKFIYQYDSNGNILAKGTMIIVSGVETAISDISDWAQFTDSTNSIEYGISGELWEYEYDVLNRLITVSKNAEDVASYTYDANGLRVKKEKVGESKYYSFDLNGNVIYEQDLDGTYSKYVYIRTTRFVREDGHTDGTEAVERYYYHTDHLGSTVMITDEAAKVVWDSEYTPFGELNDAYKKDEQMVQFTGKDMDFDTGLYYYNARWYDPNLGRFTTEDPIRDGLNWYIYANNNPLKFVDPTGLMSDAAALAAAEADVDIADADSSYGHTTPTPIERYAEGDYDSETEFGGASATESEKEKAAMDETIEQWTEKNLASGAAIPTNDEFTIANIAIGVKQLVSGILEKITGAGAKSAVASTGRTTAKSLTEKLAMEQAVSNPAAGKILPITMNDTKNGWTAAEGWVKMSQNINGVEVHYVRNTITGIVADFKFK